jgi:hypothetical protein
MVVVEDFILPLPRINRGVGGGGKKISRGPTKIFSCNSCNFASENKIHQILYGTPGTHVYVET